MKDQDFDKLVNDSFDRCLKTLISKRSEYVKGEDVLVNFKIASELNAEHPVRSLWGYCTKQIISVAGMVDSPISYNLEKWEEKLVDIHNYLFLLEALLNDEHRAREILKKPKQEKELLTPISRRASADQHLDHAHPEFNTKGENHD